MADRRRFERYVLRVFASAAYDIGCGYAVTGDDGTIARVDPSREGFAGGWYEREQLVTADIPYRLPAWVIARAVVDAGGGVHSRDDCRDRRRGVAAAAGAGTTGAGGGSTGARCRA